MKTKTLLTITAGFILFIAGGFVETMSTYYKDGGSFIQGLGCGVLIGGAIAAFVEWKEKRASNTMATQEAK